MKFYCGHSSTGTVVFGRNKFPGGVVSRWESFRSMPVKKVLPLVLAGGMAVASAHAGDIIGTVRAEGRVQVEQPAKGTGNDARKPKAADELVNYPELRDFVVNIEGAVATNFHAPYSPIRLEMRRGNNQSAVFSPHVLPVVIGTTVEWPNNDNVYHNVFSLSEAATFDFGPQKRGDKPSRQKFDKPGRVDVFCSIHANMSCIILVMENPYFSATDGRNHYLIRDVPAGTYKLKAWHERVPAQVKEITVPETGRVRVDFTLGWGQKTNSVVKPD